jgi:peptidylprolyl isomerase
MPHAVAQRPTGGAAGLLQGQPYESAAEDLMARSPDHRISAWGAYCAGVMGMGRDASPDTGNSEIFFMRDPARRLDRSYSPVGRVLEGLDVIRSLAVGEPPATPDRMVRVRVLADMPASERPTVEVVDTAGQGYQAYIERTRAQRGADFSVCDLEVPVRVTPPTAASPAAVSPKD